MQPVSMSNAVRNYPTYLHPDISRDKLAEALRNPEHSGQMLKIGTCGLGDTLFMPWDGVKKKGQTQEDWELSMLIDLPKDRVRALGEDSCQLSKEASGSYTIRAVLERAVYRFQLKDYSTFEIDGQAAIDHVRPDIKQGEFLIGAFRHLEKWFVRYLSKPLYTFKDEKTLIEWFMAESKFRSDFDRDYEAGLYDRKRKAA